MFLRLAVLALSLAHVRGFSLRRSTPKMAVLVFGASGGTGSEAAFQAVKRGEEVVAFVRDESRLLVPAGSGGESSAGSPFRDDRMTVVTGSVTSEKDVERAFATKDISGVVVALGGKTSDVGKTMLTDGTRNIIKEMKKKGVKRIAVVTSIGAGDSEQQAPFAFKILMNTVMRGIFADKNNQEALFTDPSGIGADLEWCIVRPGGLTDSPPNGEINIIEGQAGSITRGDVASFCLDAVSDADFTYVQKTPCLSSTGGTSWTKKTTGGNVGRQTSAN